MYETWWVVVKFPSQFKQQWLCPQTNTYLCDNVQGEEKHHIQKKEGKDSRRKIYGLIQNDSNNSPARINFTI